jgi:hypothetical protein
VPGDHPHTRLSLGPTWLMWSAENVQEQLMKASGLDKKACLLWRWNLVLLSSVTEVGVL